MTPHELDKYHEALDVLVNDGRVKQAFKEDRAQIIQQCHTEGLVEIELMRFAVYITHVLSQYEGLDFPDAAERIAYGDGFEVWKSKFR